MAVNNSINSTANTLTSLLGNSLILTVPLPTAGVNAPSINVTGSNGNAGGSASSNGSSLIFACGNGVGGTGADGGGFSVTGGNSASASGSGGPITMTAGKGRTIGADVTLSAGQPLITNADGGTCYINGGSGLGAGTGGNVNISAGSSGTTGVGGTVILNAGTATSGTPGIVWVATGNLRVSSLSASGLVATDSLKNLTSSVSGLSPTFTGLNLSGLTASYPVVTDASKNIKSANVAASYAFGTSNPASDTNADTALSIVSSVNTKSAQINVANSDLTSSITLWSGRVGDLNPTIMYTSGNPLRFGTQTSGQVGISGFSEKMRLTSTGTLGLGTTGPRTSSVFDLEGNMAITDGTNSQGLFVATTLATNANSIRASEIAVYPILNPATGVTVTNGVGLFIDGGSQGGLGSVTNGYGIYVNALSYGTNKYAAYFDGKVQTSNTSANGILVTDGNNIISSVSSTTSYTPTIGDGTNNFTTTIAAGSYQKIGNIYFVSIHIAWSGKGSAVSGSNVVISLPATIGASTERPTASLGYSAGIGFTGSSLFCGGGTGTAYLNLFGQSTAGVSTTVIVSQMLTSGELQANLWYFAN